MDEENLDSKEIPLHVIEKLIKYTYEGCSGQKIKQAERKIILNMMSEEGNVLNVILEFLKNGSTQDRNFMIACANFIEKLCLELSSKGNEAQEQITNVVFTLILEINCEHEKIKEILGKGLQYIFSDEKNKLIKANIENLCFNQIETIITGAENFNSHINNTLHGILVVLSSCFHSFNSTNEQIVFLINFLPLLHLLAELFRNYIVTIGPSETDFLSILKVSSFILVSCQNLFLYEDEIPSEFPSFKPHLLSLQPTFYYFLSLHCIDKSIITESKSLNLIKEAILSTISIMSQKKMDIDYSIVQLLLSCFLYEQNYIDKRESEEVEEGEKIVCLVIEVLDGSCNWELFGMNLIDIIYAFFVYAKTSAKEKSFLEDNFDKFEEIADMCTEGIYCPLMIKPKVSSLLRTFCERTDEGLSKIVQLCLNFINEGLEEKDENYDFTKLDVSFIILCALHNQINKREDLKNLIIEMLTFHKENLEKINDKIVIVRLIRIIGYYPIPEYFEYIYEKMEKSYKEEGLNAFNRICRNREYSSNYELIIKVYEKFIHYILVNDPLIQNLIFENYENVLNKSHELHNKVLNKIQSEFCNPEIKKFTFNAVLMLSYLSIMLKLEKEPVLLANIQKTYLEMENVGLHVDILQHNWISINECFLTKIEIGEPVNDVILERLLNFGDRFSMHDKLKDYPQFTDFFRFVNTLILKINNIETMNKIVNNLCNYLTTIYDPFFNHLILPHICHTITNITKVYQITIPENFLFFLIETLSSEQNEIKSFSNIQSWFLFVLFGITEGRELEVWKGLEKIWGVSGEIFLSMLERVDFVSRIQRKVSVIGALKLLGGQLDKEIIIFCVKHLKIQKEQYNKTEVKRCEKRRKSSESEEEEEPNKFYIEQNFKEGQDRDESYFDKFTHGYDQTDEFLIFQKSFQNVDRTKFSQKELENVETVTNYQWHRDVIRKVYKVNHNEMTEN